MSTSRLAVLTLLGLAMALRPEVPRNLHFEGGSLGSAMETLARAGEESSGKQGRALTEDYAHWAEGVSPTSRGSIAPPPPPSPTVAAFVGIASVVGLRDVAALGLYLLFDEAEHRGDWELCSLCLEAIPMIDPHFVEAYTIGSLYHRDHDPKKAEAILKRGLRWNPGDWELWHDAAWLHLRPDAHGSCHPALALPYLQGAVRVRHPLFVRRLWAMLLFHLGERDEAKRVLRHVIGGKGIPGEDLERSRSCLADMERGVDRLSLMIARSIERLKEGKKTTLCPVCHHHHDPHGHHGHGQGDHGESHRHD